MVSSDPVGDTDETPSSVALGPGACLAVGRILHNGVRLEKSEILILGIAIGHSGDIVGHSS